MSTDQDCIFCAIAVRAVPTTIVAEDERTVAFLDTAPLADGHALVIPRAHAVELTDIDPEDLAAVVRQAQELAVRMRSALGAQGVNLLQCSGEAAEQSVFHFHMHVIPRYLNAPERDRMVLPPAAPLGKPEFIEGLARSLLTSAAADSGTQESPRPTHRSGEDPAAAAPSITGRRSSPSR